MNRLASLLALVLALPVYGQCPPWGCPNPGISGPIIPIQGWGSPQGPLRQAAPQFQPTPRTGTVLDVVVQVFGPEGAGSGTSISNDGLILTCAHVMGHSRTARIRFPDGRTYDGEVVQSNPALDLAAIAFTPAPDTPSVSVTDQEPSASDRLWAIGWPHLETLIRREGSGRIERQRDPWGRAIPQSLRLSMKIQNGDSGGAVFTAAGQLVGVLSTKDTKSQLPGDGGAVGPKEIASFLACCPRRPRIIIRPGGGGQPQPQRPFNPLIPQPSPGTPPPLGPAPSPVQPAPPTDGWQPEIAKLRDEAKANNDGLRRDFGELRAAMATLDGKLGRLAQTAGKPGPAGPQGPAGKDGSAGKPGDDSRIVAIEKEVIELRQNAGRPQRVRVEPAKP